VPTRYATYDCAANKYVSIGLAGPPPAAAGYLNSLGLVYDAKRKLIWGMDNYNLQPHALRLDVKTADIQPMQ